MHSNSFVEPSSTENWLVVHINSCSSVTPSIPRVFTLLRLFYPIAVVCVPVHVQVCDQIYTVPNECVTWQRCCLTAKFCLGVHMSCSPFSIIEVSHAIIFYNKHQVTLYFVLSTQSSSAITFVNADSVSKMLATTKTFVPIGE